MRFVRGRVSLTNSPDYADTARRKKLKQKQQSLYSVVQNRIVGYPDNEYETKLRKNIKRYYDGEVDVDQAERNAVQHALGYMHPVPDYEPRYRTDFNTLKKTLINKPILNSNGEPFKPHYITKNGKRFRTQ